MSLFPPSFSAASTSNEHAHSLDVGDNIASILKMEAKKKKKKRVKSRDLEISFVVLISILLAGKARCLHITDGDPGRLHSNPPLSRGSQLYMNSSYWETSPSLVNLCSQRRILFIFGNMLQIKKSINTINTAPTLIGVTASNLKWCMHEPSQSWRQRAGLMALRFSTFRAGCTFLQQDVVVFLFTKEKKS